MRLFTDNGFVISLGTACQYDGGEMDLCRMIPGCVSSP